MNVVKWIVGKNYCSLAQLLMTSRIRLPIEYQSYLVENAAAKGCADLVNISF